MSKFRFGLIGYGAWGKYHARAIVKNANTRLTAIAARSEKTLAAARTDHPQAQVHADFHKMLTQPDLDVVVVVLPTDQHHEAGVAVLDAGKHLLMEKPMALTLEHCDALIAKAKENGQQLFVAHEFRLSSLWSKVKEMVEAGAIGDPQYALIELWRNPYRLGSEGWRYDINRVGNWILEEPIHFFDFARWYFEQAGDPTSVYARANAKRPDRPELQDNFSATLNFPNGAYAVISQTLSAFEHHQVVKITGTQGALWATWSGAMDRTLEPTFWLKYFDGENVKDIEITKITGEVYELEGQVEAVVRAIRDGTSEGTSGEDGRWAVAICLAAQDSVDTGKVVSLS